MKLLPCFLPLLSAALVSAAELPSVTVPRAQTAPVLDGTLSPGEWSGAAVVEEFCPAIGTSAEPLRGRETRVYLRWAPEALYVAFDCVDDEVYCVPGHVHDDALHEEDVCEVFIDGVGDARQYVELQVSPDGICYDSMFVYSTEPRSDANGRVEGEMIARHRWSFPEWNIKGLRAAAARTGRGWSAELAIPPRSIVRRLGEKQFQPEMRLRVLFVRYDHVPRADGERDLIHQAWTPILHGNPHNSPARMGSLILAP